MKEFVQFMNYVEWRRKEQIRQHKYATSEKGRTAKRLYLKNKQFLNLRNVLHQINSNIQYDVMLDYPRKDKVHNLKNKRGKPVFSA